MQPVVKQEPRCDVSENRVVIELLVTSLVQPTVSWLFANKAVTSSARHSFKSVKRENNVYAIIFELNEVSATCPLNLLSIRPLFFFLNDLEN